MAAPATDLDVAALLTTLAKFNRWASRVTRFDRDIVTVRLLALVDELQPVRLSVLAAADHTTQPTMTAHVRRLEEAGLVERVPDPSDARAALISLSNDGKTTLTAQRAARAEAMQPHLDVLDARQRGVLAEAVGLLDGLLSQSETNEAETDAAVAPSPA